MHDQYNLQDTDEVRFMIDCFRKLGLDVEVKNSEQSYMRISSPVPISEMALPKLVEVRVKSEKK